MKKNKKWLHILIGLLIVLVLLFLFFDKEERKDGKKESSGKRFYGLHIQTDGTIKQDNSPVLVFENPEPFEFPEGFGETEAPRLVTLLQDGEYESEEEQEQPFIYDGSVPIDDNWGFGSECMVTNVRISYNAQADGPLNFPLNRRSPQPGAAGVQTTGPSVGPVPGPAPQKHRVGNNFEYHSDLNGVHGCTSRQFVSSFNAVVLARFNAVAQANIRPVRPDADAAYLGSTNTGIRRLPGTGEAFYEGTADVIHWLDTPAIEFIPNPRRRGFVSIVVQLLKSVTYDGNGTSGMMCLTGHTYIVEDATGAAMVPAAAKNLLQNLNPVGGNNAAANLKQVTKLLRTAPANGGYQGRSNPEYRDLGCYPF